MRALFYVDIDDLSLFWYELEDFDVGIADYGAERIFPGTST